MGLGQTLSIALKEWDTVCRALGDGRQIILLRKGGIFEDAGQFELEHREFLLFPTFVHQTLAGLKPEAHAGFSPVNEEPAVVRISGAGVVTDILQIESRAQMDAIEAEHVWASPLIDMRFSYKPEKPLYLLLVRAYRLEPVSIQNTRAYAGCKSWVPLKEAIDTGEAKTVLDEGGYGEKRKRILRGIG